MHLEFSPLQFQHQQQIAQQGQQFGVVDQSPLQFQQQQLVAQQQGQQFSAVGASSQLAPPQQSVESGTGIEQQPATPSEEEQTGREKLMANFSWIFEYKNFLSDLWAETEVLCEIQKILNEDDSRAQIMKELGLDG